MLSYGSLTAHSKDSYKVGALFLKIPLDSALRGIPLCYRVLPFISYSF